MPQNTFLTQREPHASHLAEHHECWHVMGKSDSLLAERGRGRDQGQKALRTILKTT